MAEAKGNLSQKYRDRVQLFILIDCGSREPCRDVLFEIKISLLMEYSSMENQNINLSRIYWHPNQYKNLFPSSVSTDHNKFDLTLFTRIIEALFEGIILTETRKNFLIPNSIIFESPQQKCQKNTVLTCHQLMV